MLEELRASGLGKDVGAWAASAPGDDALDAGRGFDAAAWAATSFLQEGERLLSRLPERRQRDEPEQAAATAIADALCDTRERFLRAHAEELYWRLTDRGAEAVRLDELVYRAAERFPGLAPTREAVVAERA